MLYIIGLGLNAKGISVEGKEAVRKCRRVYLENYTVELPYSLKELQKVVGKKIVSLSREEVESDRLVKEARRGNIALLVYGSPLFATTHEALVSDCVKARVKVKIVYSAGIYDAVGETGLQLYKFGKISSMPKWQEHFSPDSFLDYVIENQNAHSLILVDLGLEFRDALKELVESCEKRKVKISKILVCSKLGTGKDKIYYDTAGRLEKKKVSAPFCFIIPGKLHFMEEEILKRFEKI